MKFRDLVEGLKPTKGQVYSTYNNLPGIKPTVGSETMVVILDVKGDKLTVTRHMSADSTKWEGKYQITVKDLEKSKAKKKFGYKLDESKDLTGDQIEALQLVGEALLEGEMKFQALGMAKDLHNKLAGLTFIDMLAVMSPDNPAKKEVQNLETAINKLTGEVGDFIQKYIPDVADADVGDTEEYAEPEEVEEPEEDEEEEKGMADEPEEEKEEKPSKDQKKKQKDNEKEIKESLTEAKLYYFIAMPLVNKGKLKKTDSMELKAPTAKAARERAAKEFGLKPDQVKAVAKYPDDKHMNEGKGDAPAHQFTNIGLWFEIQHGDGDLKRKKELNKEFEKRGLKKNLDSKAKKIYADFLKSLNEDLDEALEVKIRGGKVPVGQFRLIYRTDKSAKYIENSIKARDPKAEVKEKGKDVIVTATAQAHSSVIAAMRQFRVNGIVTESFRGLVEASPIEGMKLLISKHLFVKEYEMALEMMKKEGISAADAGKRFRHVDARTLAKMADELN